MERDTNVATEPKPRRGSAKYTCHGCPTGQGLGDGLALPMVDPFLCTHDLVSSATEELQHRLPPLKVQGW